VPPAQCQIMPEISYLDFDWDPDGGGYA